MNNPTAVALGFFDGVHKGHRAVISKAVDFKKDGLVPAVFTFTVDKQSPKKKKNAGFLQTVVQRELELEKLGVEAVLIPDFQQIASLTPRQFVKQVLVSCLYAKVVVCGEDFRFGKGASAGVEELRELLLEYDIELITLPFIWHLSAPVSSTRIRGVLEKGEISLANEMLGSPFTIDGFVSEGNKLGNKIGFPTANILLSESMVKIPYGVYASSVMIDGENYISVSNVGVKPTVGEGSLPNIETHVLDYNGNLYGRHISVSLYEFIRPEQRFNNVEELTKAINNDVEVVRKKMAENKVQKHLYI